MQVMRYVRTEQGGARYRQERITFEQPFNGKRLRTGPTALSVALMATSSPLFHAFGEIFSVFIPGNRAWWAMTALGRQQRRGIGTAFSSSRLCLASESLESEGFAVSIRTKVAENLSSSRGLATLPVRRPRRFSDFHVPQATWDYQPRRIRKPCETTRPHERDVAVRESISIPDTNMPGPVDVRLSPLALLGQAHSRLEAVLALRHGISDRRLIPIMFNCFDQTTVFACAESKKSYLYYGPTGWVQVQWPSEETMLSFDGVYPSVDAFFEEADWNRMERVHAVGGVAVQRDSASLQTNRTQEAHSGICARPWYPAFLNPFVIRSFSVQGAYMYESREEDRFEATPDESDHFGLPEPWSCEWYTFVARGDWYELEPGQRGQEDIVEMYGPELAGLVPAMFESQETWRGNTVLCPSGGAETYYLWWSEIRQPDGIWGPIIGEIHRFAGLYVSVEHFVRAADWNHLESVPYSQS
ncbi:hypothetical protein DFH09DRAFT_1086038 [Mycena vulgaris]|nr:hypothetical protein DFH09DRAFT_1086038 [Mycena vulgaris]